MLFRAFCCLCNNRQSLTNLYHRASVYIEPDSDETDSEDDYLENHPDAKQRLIAWNKRKQRAIDATTDVIIADRLCQKYPRDSSVLMHYEACRQESDRVAAKLPLGSSAAQLKYMFKNPKSAVRKGCNPPSDRHIV